MHVIYLYSKYNIDYLTILQRLQKMVQLLDKYLNACPDIVQILSLYILLK